MMFASALDIKFGLGLAPEVYLRRVFSTLSALRRLETGFLGSFESTARPMLAGCGPRLAGMIWFVEIVGDGRADIVKEDLGVSWVPWRDDED